MSQKSDISEDGIPQSVRYLEWVLWMCGDCRTIHGNVTKSGFFVVDFTLKEIKRLRAQQMLPFRDHSLDDQFEAIKTLFE